MQIYIILFHCRVDKLNLDRMADNSDIQAKIGLVGKSASRHLDTLRAQLFRECQTLFELATKPCSVVFDAFREDNYTEGICTTFIFCSPDPTTNSETTNSNFTKLVFYRFCLFICHC